MLARLKSLLLQPPLLALDLGVDEWRLLALTPRDGGYHIEKMLTQPLALLTAKTARKISWEEAAVDLRTLVERAGIRGSPVALALPGSAVFKKQIELPVSGSEAEFAAELRLRLGHYFPDLPADEIAFDFTAGSNGGGSQLLVAARKEQLLAQVRIVREAGLRPCVVDVDLYALARAGAWSFCRSGARAMAADAVLDLRWPVFSFIAFDGTDLVFHHQWSADGESLVQQTRHAWQLFQATHSRLRIERLGLAGELPNLAEIADLLREQFAVEVRVVQPFVGMSHGAHLSAETIRLWSPRFLLCAGLALRGGRR